MEDLERKAELLFRRRRLRRQIEELTRLVVELDAKLKQLAADLETLEITGTLRRFK
jgi:DNA polymerase/3'-5' exonuclease PolX